MLGFCVGTIRESSLKCGEATRMDHGGAMGIGSSQFITWRQKWDTTPINPVRCSQDPRYQSFHLQKPSRSINPPSSLHGALVLG